MLLTFYLVDEGLALVRRVEQLFDDVQVCRGLEGAALERVLTRVIMPHKVIRRQCLLVLARSVVKPHELETLVRLFACTRHVAVDGQSDLAG